MRNYLPVKRPSLALPVLAALLILVSQACEIPRSADIKLTQPEPTQQKLFQGITYKREVRTSPRPMVIHIVTVDLKANGLKLLVTPPSDKGSNRPLQARTTSDFLSDFDVQLAINANAFKPWHDLGPLGYYPHPGDPVAPIGFTASRGSTYWEGEESQPTLYVYKTNKASIINRVGQVFNAISGTKLLVNNGEALGDLGDNPQPRTAVGLNRAGSQMIIILVDGRQPGYSEGATLKEMAKLMLDNRAWDAINLDGGGSSTLVIQDESGNPKVLNSPIHQGIPGNERPVGNHLGIFAQEK